MSKLFDMCVAILYWISDVTGLSYKEANNNTSFYHYKLNLLHFKT